MRALTNVVFTLFMVISMAILLIAGSMMTAQAAQTTHSCKPVNVYTFPERIHVRCDQAAAGGIIFFAVPTANGEHAARILTALLGAHLSGRNIVVGYDPADTSGKNFGCAERDCRRLIYLGVL